VDHHSAELDRQDASRNIALAGHFLDDLIDRNCFPLPHIDRMTYQARKIDLGIMGAADLLIALTIPYNSETTVHRATTLVDFFDPVPLSHRQSRLQNVASFRPIQATGSQHVSVGIDRYL